jgi:hypothetical protein
MIDQVTFEHIAMQFGVVELEDDLLETSQIDLDEFWELVCVLAFSGGSVAIDKTFDVFELYVD